MFRETPGPGAGEAGRARQACARQAPASREDEERPKVKTAHQSIRVNLDTLEYLMTMVSELVLTRNQLLDIMRRHVDSDFKVPLQRLSNVTAELQEGVMKTRMQPIGNAWQKLPRIVRDLSAELGKDIELEMHGADTELDRQVLERIKDPLTHMVRNSADHGLESRADRIAAGKPDKGTIRLSAYHQGGHIIIGVADDGRGLDTDRIRAKALASGLATEAELDKMSEAQIHKFIFAPGFSTAAKVTSVSGRGVGMDVVRNNIDQIGGSIDVSSIRGEGLSFTIKIPLTLAIVSALIVRSRRRSLRHPAAFGRRAGARPCQVRASHRAHQGRRGAAAAQQAAAARSAQDAAEDGRRRLCTGARLHRRHPGRRADLRPGGGQRVPHRGNRREADVDHAASHRHVLGQHHPRRRFGDHDRRSERRRAGDRDGRREHLGAITTPRPKPRASRPATPRPLLVFRAGSPAPKAVPLSLVTRLEEVDGRKIELSNNRHMVQYRGHLMPLVRVNDDVRVKRRGQPAIAGVLRRRPLDGPGGR